MKSKYLLWIGFLLLATLVCTAFSLTINNDYDLAKQEIVLRKIGHEVLLNAGDSTSRVLPIKKTAENEYQIKFENELTFQTDSLVTIIKRALDNEKSVPNYIVNVINCLDNEVIYGYAIFKNKKDDIVACSGRKQPKGCYIINLKFQKSGISNSQTGYLLSGLNLLFIGFITFKLVKEGKKRMVITNESISIGSTIFNVQKRTLTFGESTTELTLKENKLLLIFANSPNETIERNRLQKEIWEDEGVIVGRSLDMFISKLRRKLECDTAIQLKNIHGKGYRLEITYGSE